MNAATIILLCLASAILGSLSKDEALHTVTVRLPALLTVLVLGFSAMLGLIVFAVICFAAGSVYGLAEWWWPMVLSARDMLKLEARPVVSGRWE